jgi:hypothetical protein
MIIMIYRSSYSFWSLGVVPSKLWSTCAIYKTTTYEQTGMPSKWYLDYLEK